MIILLLFAFLSGVVTTLSPCILPVLPVLLSVSIGRGAYRPYGIVLGLILSFSFATIALSTLVKLTDISPNLIRYIALGLIIFFGLTLIFPKAEKLFSWFTKGLQKMGIKLQGVGQTKTGFGSGFVLGGALGLVWAPCAGPILGTIIVISALGSVTLKTIALIIAYSLGTALPMFLIIYGGNKILGSIEAITPYSEIIRKIFGVLMILGSLAIAFNYDVVLAQIALKYFPTVKIEDNQLVRKELDALLEGVDMQSASPTPVIGGRAPDFIGIVEWMNSPPLNLEKLKGSVALVDFWTYSCINCVRTFPHLKKWYKTYKDQGFTIVGVHAPEFAFEKDPKNVQDALKRFEITYPVALDNNFTTWRNYHNRYWPAHYLIDQDGILRYVHFGEGEYGKTENMIRLLLGLAPLPEQEEHPAISRQTPEIYLGSARARNYTSEIKLLPDVTSEYTYHTPLGRDQVGLMGNWLISSESITSKGEPSRLSLNFIAKHVYLVMSCTEPRIVTVLLDGKPVPKEFYTSDMNEKGELLVTDDRMYRILDLKNAQEAHTLTLLVPENVALYAFTFG